MNAPKLLSLGGFAIGALASTASAQFAPALNTSTPLSPAGVALADLDGDGDLDAAVTTDNPDQVAVYSNDGTGTFTLVTSVLLPPASSAQDVVAADFDGDGDRDLAVALENPSGVIVATNGGGFSFVTGTSTPAGIGPRSLAAGDLDNDSDLDLVVGNRDGNSVTVLLNNAGTLASNGTIPTGADVRDVALADFDGNGFLDVVVSCHDSARLDVLFNGGGAVFGAPVLLLLGGLQSEGLTVGDFDGDGDQDIATAASNNGLNFASVFTNTGGTFSGPVNFPVGGLDPADLDAGDFDGDGTVDLVSANTDSGNMSFLPNTGGSFGAASTFAAGLSPEQLASGDLDGNGSLDVVVVNRDSNNISVFLNDTANFASFCTGDGGDQAGCSDCPCGNNSAAGSGGGCTNSTGGSATLIALGGTSLSAGSLRIEATGVVPNSLGVLTSGAAQAPANPANPCFAQNPGSGIQSVNLDGLRCVVQGVLRHGARTSDAGGSIGAGTAGWGGGDPFFNLNQFAAGQTRHFQLVYRELPGTVCLTEQNTTQGVTVSFTL